MELSSLCVDPGSLCVELSSLCVDLSSLYVELPSLCVDLCSLYVEFPSLCVELTTAPNEKTVVVKYTGHSFTVKIGICSQTLPASVHRYNGEV